MKKSTVTLLLLSLQKAKAILPVIVIGGGLVGIGLLGVAIWSRLLSAERKKNAKPIEIASANPQPTTPLPIAEPIASPNFQQAQAPIFDTEHNHNLLLRVELFSPNVLALYYRNPSITDYSFDGLTWVELHTNYTDGVEYFDTTLSPEMFFRARPITQLLNK